MKWNSFVLTVAGTSQVAPSLLRCEFDVDLRVDRGYQPISPGDEAIAFYFSPDGDELRTQRSANPNALGGWEIADPERSTGNRNYTVRRYDEDTARMVVDIAKHGHGPAMDWFQAAQPGWRVVAAGPRSWYAPPAEARRHVLAGDLAALPALARILEDTDPQIQVTVVAEVLDDDDTGYLPARPNTEMITLIGSGNGVAPSKLADALTQVDLPGDAYLWMAGEAADTRAVKKNARNRGLPRDHADIVGYWRQDGEAWQRRFEEVGGERLQAVYFAAVAAGKSEEEAAEIYDAALEEAGL